MLYICGLFSETTAKGSISTRASGGRPGGPASVVAQYSSRRSSEDSTPDDSLPASAREMKVGSMCIHKINSKNIFP